MKLLRSVIVGVLFLVAVFLASANTGMVELVYLPPLPFVGLDEGALVRIPVFIVVLGSVLIGVVMTGLGVLVEQSRLRWAAHGALKKANQKEKEWSIAREEVARLGRDSVTAEQQLAASRGETESARARLAQTEARLAKVREEMRDASTPSRGSTPSRQPVGESSSGDNGDDDTGCG